ncbi:MAG: pyruvate:ferredoxin (flavodoxin) oxidoreductase [Acetobacteraceae bacterium]
MLDANEAVARVAYRLSDVVAIYPITPASAMGEHADAWAASGRPNLWGSVPDVVEMQSEGGAAGAIHGALQGGALTTSFTASQGLLLMLPDLYKIAGELNAFCLHVAARSIATHALSIFCDHSDVMAARGTGMAILASSSVQEAQDLAAIAHAATLESRVPVLHVFDGFRTSHEITDITPLPDAVLSALIDPGAVAAHRARALDPDRPVLRGTSQNPDAFFQSREAAEPFHAGFSAILARVMARFADLTGRAYAPFDYAGHPEAERVLVAMGSGADCIQATAVHLAAQGARVGALKIRLFRPFAAKALLAALPASVRAMAVLDRCKEPGAIGEPLLQELTTALAGAVMTGVRTTLPLIIGGRYGLGGKEFTPAMAKAAFDNLAAGQPKHRFTLGIRDDVSGHSLPFDPAFDIEPAEVRRAVFYGLGSDGTVSANKASIRLIGAEAGLHAQAYFEYDSRKAGSTTVSHLRFGKRPIRAPWRIAGASFVAIHDVGLIERRDLLAIAQQGATVLLNTALPPEDVLAALPREMQASLIAKGCRLFAVDAQRVARTAGLAGRISPVMQACFFALSDVMPRDAAMAALRKATTARWQKRGAEVVRRNLAALDTALAGLREVTLPPAPVSARPRPPAVPDQAPDFVQRVTRLLVEGRGDDLPVSAFPPDGTWPTGTSRFEKRALAPDIPIWQPDLCVQCNRCAMICPHAAIRAKAYDPAALDRAPEGFRSVPEGFAPELEGLRYTVQVAPEDCTGCGLCIEICPGRDRRAPDRRALMAEPLTAHRDAERACFAFFETLPDGAAALPPDHRNTGFRTPLFEFSGACAGCGETPYIQLLTRLFGDRLVIANATGCSSIYGGNLPTTPYATDAARRGPAWSNSLFEDNAEFGLGLSIAIDRQAQAARAALGACAARLPPGLVEGLLSTPGDDAWIAAQRSRVTDLRRLLAGDATPEGARLATLAQHLVPRSVWTVGGDGWAYDIGFGGLDHALAGTRPVKILVLDTEVYSNTGGQQSKATPLGAAAKFASAGKAVEKKDLGLLAMAYGHVYVAQVALQARLAHAVEALIEAERHAGPALVIAHSPCIAHGYDLRQAPHQQRRAVESGAWPLYRFDPGRVARGEAPLVLDQAELPLDLADYMQEEARFRLVAAQSPERYAELLHAARAGVRRRHALYRQLAAIHLPAEGGDA